MVADGEPPRVLALLDPDSDLADALARHRPRRRPAAGWEHRDLAEAFAGTAPAPGGPFRLAEFEPTAWGPRLVDARHLGRRVASSRPRAVGLVDAW